MSMLAFSVPAEARRDRPTPDFYAYERGAGGVTRGFPGFDSWSIWNNNDPFVARVWQLTEDQYRTLGDDQNEASITADGKLQVWLPDVRVHLRALLRGNPTEQAARWISLCLAWDEDTAILDALAQVAARAGDARYDSAAMNRRLGGRDDRARDLFYHCGVAEILLAFVDHAPAAELEAYERQHNAEQARRLAEFELDRAPGHSRLPQWETLARSVMNEIFPANPDGSRRIGHGLIGVPAGASASTIYDRIIRSGTGLIPRMAADPAGLLAEQTYTAFFARYVTPSKQGASLPK